ncbi:MAG: 3-dehydroquinate synthase [Caldimonas sp.]
MTVSRLRVDAPGGAYEIVTGAGALLDPRSWQGVERDAVALIVTNTTVGPIYCGPLMDRLRPSFSKVAMLELADGEAHKTWTSIETIVDALLDHHADRHCLLIALGGGVVGDLAGFAASCFMRGVDCVQVPTTLLAQVDSSVGGKTAINHRRGKNMVGTFHQPVRVIADTDTLRTLPQREFVAGLAEVIKYGAVADDAFLTWIEQSLDALLVRDAEALTEALTRSCQIKASIVAADERESGPRVVLNFGHTFGHAIETGMGYGQWLHGEAVGCGMLLAAEASRLAGLIEVQQVRRIAELVRRAGLPTRAPSLGIERYLELMRGDKKARNGEIRLVLLTGPGQARSQPVEEALISAVFHEHEG